MTTLKVRSKLNLQQLLESGYLERHFANFGVEYIMDRTVRTITRSEKGFSNQFFIVAKDPSTNYGLDFVIYRRYMADGIVFFSEVTYSIGLNAFPFKVVTSPLFIEDKETFNALVISGIIPEDQINVITIHDEQYTRSEEGRSYFRKNSDFMTATIIF